MRLIDSHCHPQFPQYEDDRDAVIRRALNAGIGMICVGTDLETSRQAVKLAEEYEGVWASVGLHPNDNLGDVYDETGYERLAVSHPKKVIAIGEIGLDYYRTTASEAKTFQKRRFMKQLDLAARLALPVIIHCRDAHEDVAEILRERDLRGVIHSFTGTVAQAKAHVDNGFFIGLNGIVTFTSQYNEAIKTVPLERILLETDAPFLAPVPYRGKRNEPAYVLENTRKIADILGKSEETIISITSSNTCKLFNIPI